MTTEFKRLGRRGAYRLGRLRVQGVPERRPPALFRPRFARRPEHRWPVWMWLLGLLAATLIIAVSTLASWWFVPFAAGAAAGFANRAGGWSLRLAVPAVVAMALAGWGLPLWLRALRGEPEGAVARVVAALIGLPGYAAVGIVLTLVVAALQAVTGYWLGRALTPRVADDLFR